MLLPSIQFVAHSYINQLIQSIIEKRNTVLIDYSIILNWCLPSTSPFISCKIVFTSKTKMNANSTQCSQAVTHPSTNRAQHCLTSVIGRELVCSMWYGRWREVHKNCSFIALMILFYYNVKRYNIECMSLQYYQICQLPNIQFQ